MQKGSRGLRIKAGVKSGVARVCIQPHTPGSRGRHLSRAIGTEAQGGISGKDLPKSSRGEVGSKERTRALANTSSCARPLVWGRAVCWEDAPEVAP